MALIISRSRLTTLCECSVCQKYRTSFHILCTLLNKQIENSDETKRDSDQEILFSVPYKQDLKAQYLNCKIKNTDQKSLHLSPKTMCSELTTTKIDSKSLSTNLKVYALDKKLKKSLLPKSISSLAATCSYYISAVYSKKNTYSGLNNLNLGQKSQNLDHKVWCPHLKNLSLDLNKSNSELKTPCPKSNEKAKCAKLNADKSKGKVSKKLKSCKNYQTTKLAKNNKTSTATKKELSGFEPLCFRIKKSEPTRKPKKSCIRKVKAANPKSDLRTDQEVKKPEFAMEKVHPSSPTLRFIQFLRKNDKRRRLGVVSEDGTSLLEVSGGTCVSNNMCCFLRQNMSMFEVKKKIENLSKEDVTDDHTLLPPIPNPGKIICIDVSKKNEPIFLSKFPSSLVGATDEIVAHESALELDCDVELAVIIGKRGKCVPIKDAMDYVFGYSIAQDITANNLIKSNQYIISKSMDSFCPLGPSIVQKSLIKDPYNLNMRTIVNGVEIHAACTKNMSFKIDYIICRLSEIITIEPGDVIITNTPKNGRNVKNDKQYLKPGDCIQSEISFMGRLLNQVVAR